MFPVWLSSPASNKPEPLKLAQTFSAQLLASRQHTMFNQLKKPSTGNITFFCLGMVVMLLLITSFMSFPCTPAADFHNSKISKPLSTDCHDSRAPFDAPFPVVKKRPFLPEIDDEFYHLNCLNSDGDFGNAGSLKSDQTHKLRPAQRLIGHKKILEFKGGHSCFFETGTNHGGEEGALCKSALRENNS